MTDSTASGGSVDVALYNFGNVCYRGGRCTTWGAFTDSVTTKSLGVGQSHFSIHFPFST